MKVLLDTNAFLRILNGDKLPRNAQKALDQAGTELILSIVSGWEIVMKPALNLTAAEVESRIGMMGAAVLPIQFRHLEMYSRLPVKPEHKDPFDRMIIAQAMAEKMAVLTSDSRFEEYSGLRVIWD